MMMQWNSYGIRSFGILVVSGSLIGYYGFKTLIQYLRSRMPYTTGPFLVGTYEVVNTQYQIMFRAFYPTDLQSLPSFKSRPCIHASSNEFRKKYLNSSELVYSIPNWMRAVLNLIGFCWIPAAQNARISNFEDKYSIILFSHGFNSSSAFYTELCCELASHGYIVVALEHDDQVEERTSRHYSKEISELFLTTHMSSRTTDVKNVMLFLEKMDSGTVSSAVEFRDRLDLSRVSIIAQGIGAATAVEACIALPGRFSRCVNLDACLGPLSETALNSLGKIETQMLFLNSGTKMSETIGEKIEKHENITLSNVGSECQTDLCIALPSQLLRILRLHTANIDPIEVLRVSCKVSVAFVQKRLRESHKSIPVELRSIA